MKVFKLLIVVLLLVIGLVSLFMTTSIIFDLFGIREKEGNFVWFVVFANFFCSILYVLAAILLFSTSRFSSLFLAIAVVLLVIAYYFLLNHIALGGAYEMKTVIAMRFRILFSVSLLIGTLFIHYKSIKK